MHILIYTSVATGIAAAATVIYMVWFENGDFASKVLVTLLILLVVQAVGYLVVRDVKEEGEGKKDGTIAR